MKDGTGDGFSGKVFNVTSSDRELCLFFTDGSMVMVDTDYGWGDTEFLVLADPNELGDPK